MHSTFQGTSNANDAARRPSLDDIVDKDVALLRHVPKQLRNLWAQCWTRAVALCVHNNDVSAWQKLLMLPKSTLCTPPRAGQAHANQRLAFTRQRLQRWLSGERETLWRSATRRPVQTQKKRLASDHSEENQQRRCMTSCREGAYAKACKALVSEPPLSNTQAVRDQLKDKHPHRLQPPDLQHLAPVAPASVPAIDREMTEKAMKSFNPHSGAGPSALRPSFL